jgi:hypothetical protein
MRKMKKIIIGILAVSIIMLFGTAWAEKLTVDQILIKMQTSGNYQTSQGQATMQIINQDNDITEMKLMMYDKKEKGDQPEKQLMRFTDPARLKGTAILMVGDNIWYYNNRTNRVRLLSQSAKKGSMMGSSFSYEDMSINYAKDYTGEILKEDKDYYELKIMPKDKDKDYKYIITKVRKDKFLVESADYYNKQGMKYKELTSSDFKEINGRTMPMITKMKDIEENKLTVFEVDQNSIKYDQPINDKIFSERNLRE